MLGGRSASMPASSQFDSAAAALETAGIALDPNRPGGRNLPRAQEALRAALEALTTKAPEPAFVADALAPTSVPHLFELERAELYVAERVEAADGKRRLRILERIRRIALAVVVVAVAAGITAGLFNKWTSSDGLPFRVSSALEGFPQMGRLGERDPAALHNSRFYSLGLLFHTKEEDRPWMEIALKRRRTIHEVTIKNRFDCCFDRAVPLAIMVRDGDGPYHVVATRDEIFDTWVARFPPEQATFVKLVVQKSSALHLSDVQIR